MLLQVAPLPVIGVGCGVVLMLAGCASLPPLRATERGTGKPVEVERRYSPKDGPGSTVYITLADGRTWRSWISFRYLLRPEQEMPPQEPRRDLGNGRFYQPAQYKYEVRARFSPANRNTAEPLYCAFRYDRKRSSGPHGGVGICDLSDGTILDIVW